MEISLCVIDEYILLEPRGMPLGSNFLRKQENRRYCSLGKLIINIFQSLLHSRIIL